MDIKVPLYSNGSFDWNRFVLNHVMDPSMYKDTLHDDSRWDYRHWEVLTVPVHGVTEVLQALDNLGFVVLDKIGCVWHHCTQTMDIQVKNRELNKIPEHLQ